MVGSPAASTNPEPGLGQSSHRRTLLFGGTLLLAAVVVAGAYGKLTVATEGEHIRVRSILEMLPQVVQDPGRVVLFSGTSTASMDIEPAIFDEAAAKAGISVHSYNIGVPSVSLTGVMLLGRRVREAFQAAGHPPTMVLLDFDGMAATSAWRQTIEDQGEPGQCLLNHGREWFRDMMDAPAETVRTAVFCKLLGTPTTALGKSPLTNWLFEEPSWWFGKKKRAPTEEELLFRKLRKPKAIGFTMEDRGFQRMYDPETASVYEISTKLHRTPEWVKKDLQRVISVHDGQDFHFDERYIADFITAVKEWKAYVKDVRVLVPLFDTDNLKASPEGQARFEAMLARVASETGAPIEDMRNFSEDFRGQFRDVNHLDQITAVPKYTRLLEQRVEEALRASSP